MYIQIIQNKMHHCKCSNIEWLNYIKLHDFFKKQLKLQFHKLKKKRNFTERKPGILIIWMKLYNVVFLNFLTIFFIFYKTIDICKQFCIELRFYYTQNGFFWIYTNKSFRKQPNLWNMLQCTHLWKFEMQYSRIFEIYILLSLCISYYFEYFKHIHRN